MLERDFKDILTQQYAPIQFPYKNMLKWFTLGRVHERICFLLFILLAGTGMFWSRMLSDTRVYEPQTRARSEPMHIYVK